MGEDLLRRETRLPFGRRARVAFLFCHVDSSVGAVVPREPECGRSRGEHLEGHRVREVHRRRERDVHHVIDAVEHQHVVGERK